MIRPGETVEFGGYGVTFWPVGNYDGHPLMNDSRCQSGDSPLPCWVFDTPQGFIGRAYEPVERWPEWVFTTLSAREPDRVRMRLLIALAREWQPEQICKES